MKVLITGGAGFIGSHVADRLLADGHDVVILDDLSTGGVEHLQANARFYQMDLGSPWIDELFRIERPEAVVHQAAQASVRRSVEDPVFDAGVNVLGSAALLQASVRHGVRRFLFASTGGALYGDADVTPTPEDYPTLPVSPYGAAKLSAEVYLRTFNALHGLSYAALRYANVYGPRQNPHGEAGVVAIFARRLLSGEKARINGDGRQTRDFVYVGDVAEANARALFNVGTGIETDINTIFQTLKRLTGSNQPEEHGPPLPGEQRRSVVDARKIEKTLGWQPKTSLDAGLDATVRYFRAARPASPAASARPA
ncbi:MAG: NAD-dependent epimerase/dehydratase family protein [Chloroflexi bacterium]|nr:MAG: NAD-dependent epimerase/dehydratase family protein [Chloroflexota bacterium]